MKIVITMDDKTEKVYQNITDYYVCVRQLEPMQGKKGKMAMLPETKSFSHSTGKIRELLKEIRQSIEEIQDVIRGSRSS